MRIKFIFLVLIYTIKLVVNANLNCSDIMDKEGFTNCSLYNGGFPGFSCYNSIINSALFRRESCTIFPTNETLQRQHVKYLREYTLEERSKFFPFSE